MTYLSLHPAIIVAHRHPHEIKLASYYAAALGVLTATADREHSTDPDRMVSDYLRVGFNPFNRPSFYSIAHDHTKLEHFFEIEAPQRTASAFRDIVLRYYELLARDYAKNTARYFAEKITLHGAPRLGIRALFGPVREIVLVRDPRDLLCSARAFWALDPSSALASVGEANRAILRLRATGDEDTAFIRYEDLITDPSGTLDQIADFIGVNEPFATAAGAGNGVLTSHATSESPQASMGRWRTELSADEITKCENMYGPFLDAFGYQ
jgi:hypothetical protein